MLAHLATAAQEHGIETFTAQVLPHNHRMISVFRDSGFPVETRSGGDAIVIELPTSLSPAALERFERREQTAAAERPAPRPRLRTLPRPGERLNPEDGGSRGA
jgi:hypothetical protein